jgi:hypothetical protein
MRLSPISSRAEGSLIALVGVLYGGGRPSAFQDGAQRTPSAATPFERATMAGWLTRTRAVIVGEDARKALIGSNKVRLR